MKKIVFAPLFFLGFWVSAQTYKPAKVVLDTRWTAEVNPANVWSGYPRPQLKRAEWLNLNGMWNYAITRKDAKAPVRYDGKILVPFGVESSLSGVAREVLPEDEIWYNREFELPSSWKNKEVLLHFEAVDWRTRVWINGQYVGVHEGGSDPFSFNITKFLKKGKQELKVAVWDPTDTDFQARGKQALNPRGIWYTPVSGIWQTVWLEPVSRTHITQFYSVADIDHAATDFFLNGENMRSTDICRFVIRESGQVIKDTSFHYTNKIRLTIPGQQLWSPDHPFLYELRVEIRRNRKIVDGFDTYFAQRKIGLLTDKNGYVRLGLNNKPLFHWGTLDQGWWPDGLLTPPSEEAMMYDILKLKEMGFNTIRKHIKVEPARYYYMADSIGVLLWQDMPSGFKTNHPSHVKHEDKEDWVRPRASAIQYEAEWKAIIDHLRFFPSIVMWVPFNEGWGQYDTKRITDWTQKYDSSRLVNSPSGWTDRGVGDVLDVHQYPGPGMGVAELNKGRSMVLGEFGGLGLVVKDHIWDAHKRNWGYKTYTREEVLIKEYTELVHNLSLMVKRGLSAAIYTQTTDVEEEVNGLMTYDRKVIKIPAALLRKLHQPLYEQPDGHISFINQKTESDRPVLNYSLQTPPTDWLRNSVAPYNSRNPIAVKKTGNIYAWQDWELSKIPDGLGLKLYASGDVKIYINGTLAWTEDQVRIKRHYDDINLSHYIHLLKKGNNRIAVEATGATNDVAFDFSLYQWIK